MQVQRSMASQPSPGTRQVATRGAARSAPGKYRSKPQAESGTAQWRRYAPFAAQHPMSTASDTAPTAQTVANGLHGSSTTQSLLPRQPPPHPPVDQRSRQQSMRSGGLTNWRKIWPTPKRSWQQLKPVLQPLLEMLMLMMVMLTAMSRASPPKRPEWTPSSSKSAITTSFMQSTRPGPRQHPCRKREGPRRSPQGACCSTFARRPPQVLGGQTPPIPPGTGQEHGEDAGVHR